MGNIKFSILIPSVPSRIEKYLIPLVRKLQAQIGERTDVEVLCFLDNKKRSIGLKRDNLVQLAGGDFLAFVDDDDDVSHNYVRSICERIEQHPDADVIVFNQIASISKNSFLVEFGVEWQNEEARKDEEGKYVNIHRKPFHVCAWKREIAQKYRFPDCSYGEDWAWVKQLLPEVKKQVRIDDVLHFYHYDDAITEAELTFPADYFENH